MNRVALAALWGAMALALGAPAIASGQETEEILGYHVEVVVQPGGSLRVTEEITVRALGREIQRGIYRDFPTSFPRSSGLGYIVAPFEVVFVQKDGQAEPYRVESIGGPGGRGGLRVRIGDADVRLDPGVYRYTLAYRTDRWLTFGESEDQLYWNVTGNGWSFPILEASARVRVEGPQGLAPRLEAWTGPEGSTESDARAAWDGTAGEAVFTTTTPLAAGEGLTLRVAFAKGIVSPPSPEQEAAWFRLDWGGYIDGATVVIFVFAFYLLMWSRVGRDPAQRPIVTRYEPPQGFSPAALGFLEERGYHNDQLAAGLVSLAVQGAIRIEQDGRKWTVRRTGEHPADLSTDEKKLLAAVLRGGDTMTLSGSSNPRVRAAAKALRSELKRSLEKRYFVTNRRWFAAGVSFTVLLFGLLAWRVRFAIPPEGLFMGLWLTFWTFGVGTLLTRAFGEWRRALSGDWTAWFGALFITLFSVPFVGAEIFVGYMLLSRVPLHLLVTAAALGAVSVVFYHLLERPTLKGQGVLDELAGFRRFLMATDADRLDRLHDPERTPELFERFLPHAIALGVETRWAERFAGVLADRAEAADAMGHGTLGWYAGSSKGFSASGLASSLGGALSSSLSSSSAAPASSGGGGGGGGSSGGGGGGGGGGGW